MNRGAIVFAVLSVLTACSSGAVSPAGGAPISRIVVRKTMVQQQGIFLGFSEAAERISWFDATDLSETHHVRASGEIMSVQPAPNLDAVAVVRPESLTVIDSSGATREFSVPDQRTRQNWTLAADAAAFAFVSADSTSMKVIRYLGQSTWQDVAFSLPAAFSGQSTSVFISGDGLNVIVLETKTGSYAVHSAASASATMGTDALECPQSSDLAFDVKKVFLHRGSNRLFVGGKSGLLKSFSPFANGTCKSPTTWLDSSVSGQQDVSGIFAPDLASLAVVFDGADGAHLFSVSANSVALVANDGITPGLDCAGIVDGVKLTSSIPGFAGASLYVALCDASFWGRSLSIRISGLKADGTDFGTSFDETPARDDIGALAVDISSGEVFIQANDARGHLTRLTPDPDSASYQPFIRENAFLRGFFD